VAASQFGKANGLPHGSPGLFSKGSSFQRHVEIVFRYAGPLIPFLLFFRQCSKFPFLALSTDRVLIQKEPDLTCEFWPYKLAKIGLKGFTCLCEHLPSAIQPSSVWTQLNLTVMCFIFATRLVLFLPMILLQRYASDRVFLATSLAAQVQMTIAVLIIAMKRSGRGSEALALLGWSWFLLIVIFYDTFFAAKFHNSTLADWGGFCTGLVVFGSMSAWWSQVLCDGSKSRGIPLLAS